MTKYYLLLAVKQHAGFRLVLAVRIKVRPFSLRSDAPAVSRGLVQVVKDSIVRRNPIVCEYLTLISKTRATTSQTVIPITYPRRQQYPRSI